MSAIWLNSFIEELHRWRSSKDSTSKAWFSQAQSFFFLFSFFSRGIFYVYLHLVSTHFVLRFQHFAVYRKTKYKQMVACFQFSPDYPESRALIELKSRHISHKLLDGLTKLCEDEADKYLRKPQVSFFLSHNFTISNYKAVLHFCSRLLCTVSCQ